MTDEKLLEIFFSTVGHFFPKFIKWLKSIPDPRFPEMIIYQSELLIILGIFLFLFKLEARRNIHFRLAKQEFRDNLLKWLRIEGVEQKELERIAHGDTVEYLCQRLNPQSFSWLITKMISRLIRMRALEKFRLLEKYYLIAIDGTWELTFNEQHCELCLQRKAGVDAVGQPIYTYYHPVLEAKVVTATGLAFSAATEFIANIKLDEKVNFEKQKQDCELKAFYRLAPKIKAAFPQLNICLVLDGLYAAKPVFDICEKFHWKYVIVFKEGSMSAVYNEFEALKKMSPENSATAKDEGDVTREYQWVNQIDYEGHKLNALECQETTEAKQTRFVWLTNLSLNHSNVKEIAKGGRCRWKIENQGFNMQKNGGYELEHAYSLDNTAIKNYYYFLQIAHMFNQLMEKGSLLKDKLLKTFGSIKNFAAALCQAFTSHVFHFQPDFFNRHIQIRFAYDSS